MNFYISLRKQEKSWYLCNSTTNLHKIWHGNAERISEVIGCQKFQFQNSKMTSSQHLENRQIAIPQGDIEYVSQVYWPYAILDF